MWQMDFAPSEDPVVEQQLAHRGCVASASSVRHLSDDRHLAGNCSKSRSFQYSLSFGDVPEIPIMLPTGEQ
jgi:hypothetical protein